MRFLPAMRFLTAAFCAVCITTLAPDAMAGSSKSKSNRHSDDFIHFIKGNTLFTLYHEMGHALVHELELPVLGKEEDAVDNLATLLMIPEAEDSEDVTEQLVAAAGGWLISHTMREESGDTELAFWDEHGLDMQRFYSMICLLYGSDPDTFEGLAEAAELPDYRREACPRDYEQSSNSWSAVLKPHFAKKGRSGRQVTVEIETPPREYKRVAQIVIDSNLLQTVAKDIQSSFALPRTLTLGMESCGEANAFFSPDDHKVTLCYELLGQFAEMAKEYEED